MKGYGLPRNWDVGAPDCADIRLYGLKSRFGKSHSAGKQSSRRIWKRAARRDGMKEIQRQLID